MFLILVCVCCLISSGESNSCTKTDQKEFTDTQEEVKNTCDRNDEIHIQKRWRGELSIKKHKKYIEIEWKKIVHKASCVKAMEFYVDGVEQEGLWGHHRETLRINKIEQFSLKVEVFFTIAGTTGHCYGPGVCMCFEATTDVNVPDEEGGNDDNSNDTSDANNTTVNQTGQSAMTTKSVLSTHRHSN